MITKLYPGGKKKAFNITYDDGVLQDRRFVQLLNRFCIPATFHLNSALMDPPFTWVHENGQAITRLTPKEAIQLYAGHEIASHSLTHPDFTGLPKGEILRQMQVDKQNLQQLFGCEIAGFGVPFDYYGPEAVDAARECGFSYGRNSGQTLCYDPPFDYFDWAVGVYHLNPAFDTYIDGFFKTDQPLALCQIVGHSYDLDVYQMWDKMESLLKRVSQDDTIACLTHKQLVDYLKAMRTSWVSDTLIVNRGSKELWFEIDGKVQTVKPGEKIEISYE